MAVVDYEQIRGRVFVVCAAQRSEVNDRRHAATLFSPARSAAPHSLVRSFPPSAAAYSLVSASPSFFSMPERSAGHSGSFGNRPTARQRFVSWPPPPWQWRSRRSSRTTRSCRRHRVARRGQVLVARVDGSENCTRGRHPSTARFGKNAKEKKRQGTKRNRAADSGGGGGVGGVFQVIFCINLSW
jgi:hypothetical protein